MSVGPEVTDKLLEDLDLYQATYPSFEDQFRIEKPAQLFHLTAGLYSLSDNACTLRDIPNDEKRNYIATVWKT